MSLGDTHTLRPQHWAIVRGPAWRGHSVFLNFAEYSERVNAFSIRKDAADTQQAGE